jgi:hypothetical protein
MGVLSITKAGFTKAARIMRACRHRPDSGRGIPGWLVPHQEISSVPHLDQLD